MVHIDITYHVPRQIYDRDPINLLLAAYMVPFCFPNKDRIKIYSTRREGTISNHYMYNPLAVQNYLLQLNASLFECNMII